MMDDDDTYDNNDGSDDDDDDVHDVADDGDDDDCVPIDSSSSLPLRLLWGLLGSLPSGMTATW